MPNSIQRFLYFDLISQLLKSRMQVNTMFVSEVKFIACPEWWSQNT